MDFFSIIFGLYIDNIIAAVKWCFSNRRIVRVCIAILAFSMLGFFARIDYYGGIVERETAKQKEILDGLRRDRQERERERERLFKAQVDAVLNRRKEDGE